MGHKRPQQSHIRILSGLPKWWDIETAESIFEVPITTDPNFGRFALGTRFRLGEGFRTFRDGASLLET